MPDLTRQLNHLARRLRLRGLLRGLLLWLAAGGLLSALLAAAARAQAPAWALPVYLALVGATLVACLLRPLAVPLRRRQVALLIERQDPSLQEMVLSAAELAESPGGYRQFSPRLTAALLEQAQRAVAAAPREELLQTRRLRPLAVVAAISLLLGLSLTVLYRDSLAAMLQVTPELPAAVRLVPQSPLPHHLDPLLCGVQIRLTPPAYTHQPARLLTGNLRTVKAPVGSLVSLSSLQPASGTLALKLGNQACKLAGRGQRAGHAFTLTATTRWELTACAGDRSVSRNGIMFAIVDYRPTVRLTYPARDLTLDSLKPLKLAAIAVDDYGLAGLALEYLCPGQKTWQRVELGASGTVQRVEYEWDLSPLNLQPGQRVSYRFMVRDNNVLIGPQVGYSQTFQVTLADSRPRDAQKRLQQAQEQQGEALQKLRDQAEEVQQQVHALQQELPQAQAQGQQAELTPEQRSRLQQAAAELQKQADDLRQSLAQTEQTVRQSGNIVPELARKMEEVNRLLSETLDKELKQAIEQLQQALRAQQPPQQVEQTLQQAEEVLKRLAQRLDQMLALLQQAKLEGDLAALRTDIEKLAARQQELINQRQKQAGFDQQARDQKELGRDTEGLPQRLESLAAQAGEQAPKVAEKLQRIADKLREVDPARQMQQAAQCLRGGQPQQAAGPQAQALQSLQQAAADVAGAQAEVYSETREQLQQAAAELVADALYLSGQQELLREQTEPYEGGVPELMMRQKSVLERLSRCQQALSAGAGGLAQQLARLAQKSPVVDPGLALEAGGVAQQSAEAERALAAGAINEALAAQDSATIGLNQLAERLLQSDQQFQQASAQMALQEYMKRLQQLAEQQRGLNQRSQQQGGGMPQPMPGGGQLGGNMPGSLAAQQAAIRQALQKMLSQAGKQGGLGDQLGGVPGQMDDVEKDLRGGQITRQTFRTQGEILHKMLDAQRSLYQKDREERQRKAEAPKPYKAPSSPPALRQTVAHKTLPAANAPRPDLPLGYEELTRKYFEAVGRH